MHQDPRPPLYRAYDQAAAVIARVTPADFGRPTPCVDYDVHTLLGHVLFAARRAARIARREDVTEATALIVGIPDHGWSAAFDEARQDAFAGWKDDTLLTAELVLPFGTFPGAVVAGIYTLELVTHSWDLAVATGQVDDLDPELAEGSLAAARMVLPPDPRGGEMPFGPVIPIDEAAPVYDRLAAWLGRVPTFTPAGHPAG